MITDTQSAVDLHDSIVSDDDTVEDFPAARPRIGAGWTDSWVAPSGGTARRRIRRVEARAAKKRVKVANRRRFRAWESQQRATSTLISQVRIYSGEIGTPRQRERVTRMFTTQAQALGQSVDEVVAALRTGLGLDG